MPILCTSLESLAARGNVIRTILSPIAGMPGGPAWNNKATATGFIIATHDGAPPTSDYRDWRFATILPGFRGMYFERWLRVGADRKEIWYLERAYLNLYETIGHTRQETEYLCLHIDPNLPNDTPHWVYKRGPHLHMSAAKHPIPRAHIALNRGHLDEVLRSVESLSQALGLAINMIKEEIFDSMKIT